MLNLRGFSAWIISNGVPITEHLVTVDETTNQVSCWIPGEEGRTFSVYWQDHGSRIDTCSYIDLDGFTVPGRFLFGEGMAYRQGVRTGYSTERPFVFDKVDETTLKGASSVRASNKDSGMIVLRIKRVMRSGPTISNAMQTIPYPNVVNRRPGDLCVGYGPDQKEYDQFPLTWRVKAFKENEILPDQPSTYVKFVFRYRTREFLVSQGIANEAQISVFRRPPELQIQSRSASAPPEQLPNFDATTPDPNQKKKKKRLGSTRKASKGKQPKTEDRRVFSLQETPQTQLGDQDQMMTQLDLNFLANVNMDAWMTGNMQAGPSGL